MSAGGLISLGINNVIIGFVSGILGFVVDFINGQTVLFALSQGTLNTMNYVTLMFWMFAFCFFIVSILNYIVVSINEGGGWS